MAAGKRVIGASMQAAGMIKMQNQILKIQRTILGHEEKRLHSDNLIGGLPHQWYRNFIANTLHARINVKVLARITGHLMIPIP